MSARHYYEADGGTLTEVTQYVQRVEAWEGKEQAEEGATPSWTIWVEDTSLALFFEGHRKWRVIEDESTSDDDVLISGWTGTVRIGSGEAGGEHFEPTARVFQIAIVDENAVWFRRVLRGKDADRPEESDTERMAWLLSTGEAGFFDDVTTYVASGDGKAMDAADYRGMMFDQVADDCAQQSGRNWFTKRIKDGGERKLFAFYGHFEGSAYSSPLSLSNDPGDWTEGDLADDSSLILPWLEPTWLERDVTRLYSGGWASYDGGNAFVNREATAAQYVRRDIAFPALKVRTKAKAQARIRRLLDDVRHPYETITTAVELSAARATQIRAGMLLPFKATHEPGFEDFVGMRVLEASPSPVAGGHRYNVGLKLVAPVGRRDGSGVTGGGGDDGVYAVLYAGEGPFGDDKLLWYGGTGDAPPSGWGGPSTGHVGPTATVGPFVFLSGGTPKPRSPYYGIQVDGGDVEGTVIRAGFSTTGVRQFAASATYAITVNDVVVETETHSAGPLPTPTGWADYVTLTTDPMDLHDGDIVRTTIVHTGLISYFYQPIGIGHNGEALEIIGGTIV